MKFVLRLLFRGRTSHTTSHFSRFALRHRILSFVTLTMAVWCRKRESSSLYCVLFAIALLIIISDNKARAMRIVVQRVKSASVTVDNKVVSEIGPGLLALVGLHQTDDASDVDSMCRKLLSCKLWENANGAPWRQSVKQKGYDVLLVSQFTLYGRLTKKNQPDYQDSMKAVPAAALYQSFVDKLRQEHTTGKVCDGIFGAMMDVALVNDGPVTIMIDSPVKEEKTNEEETAMTEDETTTEEGNSVGMV